MSNRHETQGGTRITGLPIEIAVGAHGLVLRRWRMDDAGRLLAAIEASVSELRPWMPWAQEPQTPASVRAFIERSGVESGSEVEMGFGLFDVDGGLVGALGLHGRRGPGVLEIGYWIRTDRTGRGYATGAVRALTEAAFAGHPDVDRVEIRCHPDNLASAAIPPKLGYRLDTGPGADQLVWAVMRDADYLANERW